MATKSTPAPSEPQCVVEGRYLLPQEEATQLMLLLLKARRVDYNWSSRCFRYSTDADAKKYTIEQLQPVDLAKLEMEAE
jgi:hypothetical protein